MTTKTTIDKNTYKTQILQTSQPGHKISNYIIDKYYYNIINNI